MKSVVMKRVVEIEKSPRRNGTNFLGALIGCGQILQYDDELAVQCNSPQPSVAPWSICRQLMLLLKKERSWLVYHEHIFAGFYSLKDMSYCETAKFVRVPEQASQDVPESQANILSCETVENMAKEGTEQYESALEKYVSWGKMVVSKHLGLSARDGETVELCQLFRDFEVFLKNRESQHPIVSLICGQADIDMNSLSTDDLANIFVDFQLRFVRAKSEG
eukprot:Gregarina_sp_Poly_1__7136@NODE_3908_length_828_cov_8_010512_g2526_i0_p1_GENE_NODE_3908_length_828_cov_8_010512_g2526_i0NODE_3908_length_828_cov_8_010512_g2526_i0_p1_ORF_typecomplete_len248_score20_09IL4_i_Ig/PF18258_1/0_12_NODE_3908_length_828_cov_8_010512_g2526_i085744